METDVASNPRRFEEHPVERRFRYDFGKVMGHLHGFDRIARQPRHPYFHANGIPFLGLDDVSQHLGFRSARIDAAKMEPAADLGGHAAVLLGNVVCRIGKEQDTLADVKEGDQEECYPEDRVTVQFAGEFAGRGSCWF